MDRNRPTDPSEDVWRLLITGRNTRTGREHSLGMRRALVLPFALLALGVGVPSATAAAGPGALVPRLLVPSAMPTELDALLPAAHIHRTVEIEHRAFYVGRLEGNAVVMALTGIGLRNAHRTSELAFRTFRCGPAPAIDG